MQCIARLLILPLAGLVLSCSESTTNPPVCFDLEGTLLSTDVDGTPLDGAIVQIDGEIDTVASDGAFTIECLSQEDHEIWVRTSSEWSRYWLSMSGTIGSRAFATFYWSPLYAIIDRDDVEMRPSRSQPAGTVTIISPADSAVISNPTPGDAMRFQVCGEASPSLGAPGCPYFAYVCVTPISPIGGGTFPQKPPLAIDPTDGHWCTEAQLGSEGAPPDSGDTFQMLAVVTDIAPADSNYTRPIDIPGVVYVSAYIDLTVGP